MNVRKWHPSEMCIVINDKSQGSTAKHLRCDELLYYTFIIQSAGECFKLVNIWTLEKLQAKWLIVSCASFALHFCPQRCWSHQISWTACVLRTETVTRPNRCYVALYPLRSLVTSVPRTELHIRRTDLHRMILHAKCFEIDDCGRRGHSQKDYKHGEKE